MCFQALWSLHVVDVSGCRVFVVLLLVVVGCRLSRVLFSRAASSYLALYPRGGDDGRFAMWVGRFVMLGSGSSAGAGLGVEIVASSIEGRWARIALNLAKGVGHATLQLSSFMLYRRCLGDASTCYVCCCI